MAREATLSINWPITFALYGHLSTAMAQLPDAKNPTGKRTGPSGSTACMIPGPVAPPAAIEPVS
jgi:hypothetical protein